MGIRSTKRIRLTTFRDKRFQRGIAFLFFVLVVFGSVYMPGTLHAYVPHGEHLLQLMVEKSGNVRSLKLIQRQRIWTSGGAEQTPVDIPETLRFRFPAQFRSDIDSDNIQRIHLVSGVRAFTIRDGEIRRDSENWFDRYKDLILYRSRRTLAGKLSEIGLDTAISSLGRFEGRITWVIGAQYPNEDMTQLWLDKHSFRPVRWLLVRKGFDQTPETLDIRYLRWKQTDGLWYPMQVEFHQNGRLLREIVVEDIAVNPTFSENIFDIRRIEERVLLPSPDMKPDRSGTASHGEIDETLEEFRRIFK